MEAAVIGAGAAALAAEAATKKLAKVYAVEHDLLKDYTADAYTAAVEQLIRKTNPKLVLFPHTYQVRDFAPKLATRFSQVLVSDVISARFEAGSPVFVRLLFQGKLNGDVRVTRRRTILRIFAGRRMARGFARIRLSDSGDLHAVSRCFENPAEARSSVPRIGARGGSDRCRNHRFGGPRD